MQSKEGEGEENKLAHFIKGVGPCCSVSHYAQTTLMNSKAKGLYIERERERAAAAN